MTCRNFFKNLDPKFKPGTKTERILEYAKVDMNNVEIEHLPYDDFKEENDTRHLN